MEAARRTRALLALLGAAALTLLVAQATGAEAALTVAPALLLGMLLSHGIAPGEQLIERLRRRLRRPRRRLVRRIAPPALPVLVRPAGLRLADALAMRPPPAARPARR